MTALDGSTETANETLEFVPFDAFKPFDVVTACALRTEIKEKSITEHTIRRSPLIAPNSFYSPPNERTEIDITVTPVAFLYLTLHHDDGGIMQGVAQRHGSEFKSMLRVGLAAGVAAGALLIATPVINSVVRGSQQTATTAASTRCEQQTPVRTTYRVDVSFKQEIKNGWGPKAHLVPLYETVAINCCLERLTTIPAAPFRQDIGTWHKGNEITLSPTAPNDLPNRAYTLVFSVSGHGLVKVGNENAKDSQRFEVVGTVGSSGTVKATITGTWVELLCSSTTRC